MNTAASASANVRDATRDATKEVREGLREARGSAEQAAGDIQSDLLALRADFTKLTDQVADILARQGGAAWQRARSGVDDVVANAQDKGREAVGAMRDVSDNFVAAIDESLDKRPYTTLALVAAVGFLFGATWRR
jgi:ElaB/YqjD/DUF883 family membrane-anchored ribosome-binding protein